MYIMINSQEAIGVSVMNFLLCNAVGPSLLCSASPSPVCLCSALLASPDLRSLNGSAPPLVTQQAKMSIFTSPEPSKCSTLRLLDERFRVPESEMSLGNIAFWDFWSRGPKPAGLAPRKRPLPTVPLHKKCPGISGSITYKNSGRN